MSVHSKGDTVLIRMARQPYGKIAEIPVMRMHEKPKISKDPDFSLFVTPVWPR